MQKYGQLFIAFFVGVIFSIGLAIAGMTQPQKVIGFLQWGEGWDPSLLFVMMAAIPVHALSYLWIRGKRSPLFDSQWHIPKAKELNKPLMVGSALFGFGWALGGYCPGPGLSSLGSGNFQAGIFVAAMIVGMSLHRLYQSRTKI
ncbi:YeeE/YedE thiosulfate transporter family protein [Bdellovibrio sp. 22V]|uniref:DUF6691 family protein n=1 Tax=Bdellovibrio sp. 22V TaxID=3044166 RepID=UPI002542EE10|nr:DUF6691 family protein [Bdellovibrio sp. 22V]WII71418.1 YeeE/YedE thiosulfate transporter family protein [Bdellovibrio sp. 22V]